MKKLIIIPAYNESESIEGTITHVLSLAGDFDYIIINDCSTDDTADICRRNGYHMLDLPVNLGIGGAVQTGYWYALENGYDMAVQVDADGQHDISYLSKMVEYMEQKDADLVIGSRFIDKKGFQSSALRRMGITYFTWLIHVLTKVTITDPTSGFRLANRKVIREFAYDYPRDYPEPESAVLLIRKGYRIEEVPVEMKERQGGASSIHGRRSVYYMIKVTLAILVEWVRK